MNTSLRSTDSDRKLFHGPLFGRGVSPGEELWRAYIAANGGWAGFSMPATPENDADEAAQALAGANEARIMEDDVRINRAREWAGIDSIEALMELGVEVEIADPASFDEDDDEAIRIKVLVREALMEKGMEFREDSEDDGEDYDEEVEYPRDVMNVMRDGEFCSVSSQRDVGGAPGRYWRRCQQEVIRIFSGNLVAAFSRHAERRLHSVEGTVTRHAEYGIFVERGGKVGLVHVDTIRGFGSRNAALAFLHGHTVGTKTRVIPGKFRAEKRRYDLELF